jgi:5-methylcytosine-specific restriction endonuclease McrA
VAGELSLAQAHEIAAAQAEAPGAEHELVDLARRSGLSAVRDAVRDRALQQSDPARLYEAQRRKRELHHWRDRDGMVRWSVAFTPEVGVPLINRLEAEAERLRAAARRAGAPEPYPAYMSDALAAMLSGAGPGSSKSPPGRAELVLVCDVGAYRRGHAHAGEVCHVQGGGPLPVERVRQLSEDAFLKAVVHDGVRISTVKHFGRHIPAELRTALELGPPPGFAGTACAEQGCGRRYGLEWDHVDPVAHGGPTSYQNLQPRCWPHHRDKTERDRAAGLLARGPT